MEVLDRLQISLSSYKKLFNILKEWFGSASISKFDFYASFLNKSQRWYKHLLNVYLLRYTEFTEESVSVLVNVSWKYLGDNNNKNIFFIWSTGKSMHKTTNVQYKYSIESETQSHEGSIKSLFFRELSVRQGQKENGKFKQR